jgi:hypothetical protein
MRFRALFPAVGTLAALTLACSSLRTSVDYDRSLDFSRYRTFAFRTGTPARRETTQRRIEQVIAASLEARGLAPVVGESPDLHIFTHVVVENDRRIDTIVYGYGWRSGGIVATNVITIPVGTLIVDLVDTFRDELVWRGRATDAIAADSTARDEQLREAVARMFEGFPPMPDAWRWPRELPGGR